MKLAVIVGMSIHSAKAFMTPPTTFGLKNVIDTSMQAQIPDAYDSVEITRAWSYEGLDVI